MVGLTLRTVAIVGIVWISVGFVVAVAFGKVIQWADRADAERRRREPVDELARRRRCRSR